MNVKRYQGDLCFSFMCFWCATDPKGEMIGNRKILSAGSTWKNLGLDMPSLDATKKLIEHQVSNSWSLNFYKSLIKWLFMICVHVSECHDMFFTEKIYICTHIICIYIHICAMGVCMRTYTNYHILITQHGPTWTFLLNSLTPGGRVFLASNLDASVLQPLEAPGIS